MQRKVWIFISVLVIIGVGVGIALYFLVTSAVNRSDAKCESFQAPSSLSIIKRSEDILISWHEPWPNEECNVSYKLQYAIDDVDAEDVYVTGTYHILPHLNLCSSINACLWAISKEGELSSNFVTQDYEDQPTSLGPIENLTVDVTEENVAVISWSPPENAGRCINLIYVVNARNEETGEEKSCTEKITCSLNLGNYCPQTTFTVIEASGITEEALFLYVCD